MLEWLNANYVVMSIRIEERKSKIETCDGVTMVNSDRWSCWLAVGAITQY